MRKIIIFLLLIGIIVVSGCIAQDNIIDRTGTLKYTKGILFCVEEECIFVKDLGKESEFGYDKLWDLANKETRVHIIGKIETLPANEPNCEVAQRGCQEFNQIVIEELEIL